MNAAKRIGLATLLALPCVVNATNLDRAAAIEGATVDAAAASQTRIDGSDERAQQAKADIAQLQREIENLTLYRNHLQSLVTSQQNEQASLTQQRAEIAQTRQGIVPLMYRMIDDLDAWVAQDVPIKKAQREARIKELKQLMTRADVADAEKFRRILEAFQIERDYGAKLATYPETLSLDGVTRDVDVLHLGRLSLVAKSLSGDKFWYFDAATGGWKAADKNAYASLQQAFDVANKKQPPALLSLPLAISASSNSASPHSTSGEVAQ